MPLHFVTCFYHPTESRIVCIAGNFVGKHACKIIVQLPVRLLRRLASSHSPCDFSIAFSSLLAAHSHTPQHTRISRQMQSNRESRLLFSNQHSNLTQFNQIEPVELDQAQSNAIKCSISFNLSNIFVGV